MSDSQVSVGGALSYAWTLWRGHWREIWGVLALNGLAWTVFCAGLFAGNPSLLLGGGLAQMLISLAVYGAVVRLACGADHPDDPDFRLGGLGLQWRRMELRLLGAQLLIYLFAAIFLTLLMLVLAAGMMAVMMTRQGPLPAMMTQQQLQAMLGPQGMEALQISMGVAQLIMILVLVRLSLSLATTADTGRISVLRTWKVVRGRYWQILAATILIVLPTWLIMSLAGAQGDSQAAALPPGEMFAYSLICGGWAGAAATPLMAAVQTYFYRKLTPLS